MPRTSRPRRDARRLSRWLRRWARVAVAVLAITTLFAGTGVAQAVAASFAPVAAQCACEHERSGEATIDALCRCCTRDRAGKGQLPGSCCASAVAPAAATPILASDGIADAACVGLIDASAVTELRGLRAVRDLDRPPRA